MRKSLSDAGYSSKLLMPGIDEYRKRNDVERFYRSAVASDLNKFRVAVGESDLWILASADIQAQVKKLLTLYRRHLKEYIHNYPGFAATLQPYPADHEAPELVQKMITASAKAGVGPMAAVAGAIAGLIGRDLKNNCPELIIENGGDIYLHTKTPRTISIYAGQSIFSLKLGLQLPPQPDGLGVCTSAGTVGPSLSLGRADAAVIISPDAALADAVATAAANRVQKISDLPAAIELARAVPGITGAVVIKGDKMAAWGSVDLVPLNK